MNPTPNNDDGMMTFWDHLDVLRSAILKIIVAAAAFSVLAFVFKDPLFRVILAPSSSTFITYRLLGSEDFALHLINTGLTEQFMIHLKTAFSVGLLLASPYVVYVLYQFIAPALYPQEKRYVSKVVGSGYLLFLLGVVVNYFIVFPFTVRFLGTYSVSSDVENMLSIQSYIDTLLMLSFVFGVLFELPVLSWLLAKLGMLKYEWMMRYRRHAIIVVLIVAAIVTPTSDVFTLLIVSLPIWLLYEVSILVVKHTTSNQI
jgi:sec-independent protein translocase protein TatC